MPETKSLLAAHVGLPADLQHRQSFHSPVLHQFGRVFAGIRRDRSRAATKLVLQTNDPVGCGFPTIDRIDLGTAHQFSPLCVLN